MADTFDTEIPVSPFYGNEIKSFDKKAVLRYLAFTFGVAYAIQAGVALLYKIGQPIVGQLVMSVMMFVPMLGVIVSGRGLRGLGWKPGFRRNLGRLLVAWFAPLILTLAGAALYFAVFPDHFDISGAALIRSVGEDALAQLEQKGLSYPMYIAIAAAQCLFYAPALNAGAALGEEVGWRGFLYPQLRARFGRRGGMLLGGVIWGAWHWPLIWLIGYEYGTDYFGFPVVGMLLFLLFTVSLGIITDRLYETGGSIWIPAVLHGSINAAATLPAAVCAVGTGSAILLGPVPNGLLAGLPIIAVALVMLISAGKNGAKTPDTAESDPAVPAADEPAVDPVDDPR